MKIEKISFFTIIILSLLCLPLVPEHVYAITLNADGSWTTLTINSSNLTSGAGSDLTSTYESASDQVNIDIYGTILGLWRVDISKTDSTWHSNLHLYAKRTGNGTGLGYLSGGTSYQEATGTTTEFFRSTLSLLTTFDVPIQFKLDGVSVQIPANTYSTTVYFTVTGL